MIISRLELHNWKNFRDCSVDLAKRCFIVGPNAVGKSNFLDAIRFLRDLAKQGGGLQSAVASRGGVTKIRCLAAHKSNNVKLTVYLSENNATEPLWRYSIDFRNTGGGIHDNKATIISEQVYSYEQNEMVCSRRETDEAEDSETLLFTYLEQANANKFFRDVRDVFQNMEYLNVVPQLVRESSTTVITLGKEDYYGRNFLQRLSKLNTLTRNSYLNKISDVMKYVVPQLTQLAYVQDNMGVPHLEAKYEHWRARGARQDETLFSDGTIRMIGFLFAMLDGNGLIMLEEPEINLHSAVVAQIPEFIAMIQRTKGRQVLLTTHSFDILSNQGIQTKEVLFLENTPNGTTVCNMKDNPELKRLVDAGLTVADAVLTHSIPTEVDKISRIQ